MRHIAAKRWCNVSLVTSQTDVLHLNRAILDCPCHPASWGPIMRRAPTLSGRRSTGFLSPATRCSAGSSATSSTSCCETAIRTYVRKTRRPVTQKYHENTHVTSNSSSPSSSLSLPPSLQVIKDSMRNKADLTDMSRMWVRTQRLFY